MSAIKTTKEVIIETVAANGSNEYAAARELRLPIDTVKEVMRMWREEMAEEDEVRPVDEMVEISASEYEMVEISAREYEMLLKRSYMLTCMEALGVEDWEHYDRAEAHAERAYQ